MNSSLGKSIARLARSITTNDAQDEETTVKPPESIDGEVTEASKVDAIAHKLPANQENPIEKEAEKETVKEPATTATNPPIDDASKAPRFVSLVVSPPPQLNAMSPPLPRKLRSASRKPNRDASPATKKRPKRCIQRNTNRGKDTS